MQYLALKIKRLVQKHNYVPRVRLELYQDQHSTKMQGVWSFDPKAPIKTTPNLLNELWKCDKNLGSFNKFNDTKARMIDSINYMTILLL